MKKHWGKRGIVFFLSLVISIPALGLGDAAYAVFSFDPDKTYNYGSANDCHHGYWEDFEYVNAYHHYCKKHKQFSNHGYVAHPSMHRCGYCGHEEAHTLTPPAECGTRRSRCVLNLYIEPKLAEVVRDHTISSTSGPTYDASGHKCAVC